MLQSGLPVPIGFCVEDSVSATDPAIAAAYEAIGDALVAVRSSAVGEDEAAAAFAGVFCSRLGVRGIDKLASAIGEVRRLASGEHVSAYQPGGGPLRMAVLVQRLVEADVAGVLFTRDPLDESGRCMSVSATWGLGVPVVSGTVTPDRFQVERDGSRVVTQTIARKRTRQTVRGVESVLDDQAKVACLAPGQLGELAALAFSVERLFGEPCDIEWAFAEGQFWLLQARPITTAPSVLPAKLRDREIQSLRVKAELHGTVWARYQLAESAPRPTPMTWGVLQSLLSVRGGYGRMLRALGFDPDPRVDDAGGFVQLVAGHPYLNLNREARLDFSDIPYSLNWDRLKADPSQALRPQRELTWGRTTPRFWARLPLIMWRAWRQSRQLRQLEATYADDLRRRCGEFATVVDQARSVGFASLPDEALLDRFTEWRRRTLEEFAEFALQPAIFAALALTSVPKDLTSALAAPRDLKTEQAAALHAVLRGALNMQTFLQDFGHRGPEELELSQPRWRETPPAVSLWRASGRDADVEAPQGRPHGRAPTGPAARYEAAVALRETGRHYLMMGYSYLRDVLLELDRRHDLAGGIFFLRPDELPRLLAREPVDALIRDRRREYNLLRGIAVPAVLFSDDLDAIGRPSPTSAVADWTGTPISPGEVDGEALIARSPTDVPADARPGFVLVCPFADAAWLPALVKASAVVLETGDPLAHGAVLLRELGLPAVANVPGILTAVASGRRIRVNGQRGTVSVAESEAAIKL